MQSASLHLSESWSPSRTRMGMYEVRRRSMILTVRVENDEKGWTYEEWEGFDKSIRDCVGDVIHV